MQSPARRQFLHYAIAGLVGLVTAPSALSAMTMSMPTGPRRPPRQASPDFHPDVDIELTAEVAAVPILPGQPTQVLRYVATLINGPQQTLTTLPNSYLGPVLRLIKGQRVRIRFRNQLPESTITHWHGLHVPAAMDGHPMDAIGQGESYVYEFEVVNRAGAYIYHPHPHGSTASQVYRGLAGAILVSDTEEQALALPSGEYEIPVILQDRSFGSENRLVYAQHMHDKMLGFYGDRVLVNGRPDFILVAATRAYRLRVVNASNARIYKLAWDNGMPMTVIGVDGGLLDAPLTRPYAMLAPGERLDVWADFSDRPVGTELTLRSLPFSGVLPSMHEHMHGGTAAVGNDDDAAERERGGHGMGRMGHGRMGGMGGHGGAPGSGGMRHGGMGGTALPVGSDYPVFTVRIARAVSDSPRLPMRLANVLPLRWEAAHNRDTPIPIRLSEGPMSMLLNGRPYQDNDALPFEHVPVNTMQLLEIFHTPGGGPMGQRMAMAHPIHLHGQQFQILSRSVELQAAPGYHTVQHGLIDSGWKDTVLVMPGERVRIVKRFDDYRGVFMYHCHNLEHEDMGMMREFVVE